MKNKEKKVIFISIIVILLLIIVFIIKANKKSDEVENIIEENKDTEECVQVQTDGTKIYISEKLSEQKMIDGIKFENIQLTNNNYQTVLLADITNTTNETTKLTFVTVVVLDKSGNEIGKINGAIAPLKPGEKMQFNAGTTLEYSNAYDFKIIKK